MAEKDSVLVRLVFTDPAYAPDPQGMENISRLFNEIFKDGGILVIPEQITVEWVKERTKKELLARKAAGLTLDMEILNAVKAVEIQHVRVDFE